MPTDVCPALKHTLLVFGISARPLCRALLTRPCPSPALGKQMNHIGVGWGLWGKVPRAPEPGPETDMGAHKHGQKEAEVVEKRIRTQEEVHVHR